MTQMLTLYLCVVAVLLSATAETMKMRAPVGSPAAPAAAPATARAAALRPRAKRCMPYPRPGGDGRFSASARVANAALTTGFRHARPLVRRRLQPREFFQISENLRKTAFSMCYRDVTRNGDACYGCFMRATNELQCNGTETRLRNCTTEYLDGTPFADCANALKNNSNDTGVCEFEECIRKADTNELSDGTIYVGEKARRSNNEKATVRCLVLFSHMEQRYPNLSITDLKTAKGIIRECMQEVETTNLTPDSFLDMTTCILAKARCRMNRNQLQFGGMEPLNALLVTDTKEFRVVDVPGGYIGGYECRANDYMNPRITKPARWHTVSCGGTC